MIIELFREKFALYFLIWSQISLSCNARIDDLFVFNVEVELVQDNIFNVGSGINISNSADSSIVTGNINVPSEVNINNSATSNVSFNGCSNDVNINSSSHARGVGNTKTTSSSQINNRGSTNIQVFDDNNNLSINSSTNTKGFGSSSTNLRLNGGNIDAENFSQTNGGQGTVENSLTMGNNESPRVHINTTNSGTEGGTINTNLKINGENIVADNYSIVHGEGNTKTNLLVNDNDNNVIISNTSAGKKEGTSTSNLHMVKNADGVNIDTNAERSGNKNGVGITKTTLSTTDHANNENFVIETTGVGISTDNGSNKATSSLHFNDRDMKQNLKMRSTSYGTGDKGGMGISSSQARRGKNTDAVFKNIGFGGGTGNNSEGGGSTEVKLNTQKDSGVLNIKSSSLGVTSVQDEYGKTAVKEIGGSSEMTINTQKEPIEEVPNQYEVITTGDDGFAGYYQTKKNDEIKYIDIIHFADNENVENNFAEPLSDKGQKLEISIFILMISFYNLIFLV